jgi:hypothetical protein
MDSQSLVSTLQAPTDYQQARQHLFPSFGSLQWYMRRNRPELEKSGALLMIAGRLMVDPASFDQVVVDAGRRHVQGAAEKQGVAA